MTATIGWFAVALAALALVVIALNMSGVGPFSPANRPISQAQAESLLADVPSAAHTAVVPTPPSGPATAANETVVVTAGGTVGISCSGDTARVDYESPTPGYIYTLLNSGAGGPTLIAALTRDRDLIAISAYCTAGEPKVKVS